jgi:hypothetical protein
MIEALCNHIYADDILDEVRQSTMPRPQLVKKRLDNPDYGSLSGLKAQPKR